MPTRDVTSSLAFPVLSFSAPPGLDYHAVLLPVSNSSMLAILMAFSRIPSDDSWVVTATALSSLLLSSNDVFVAIRCLVFGSVELLDSSLSFPSLTRLPLHGYFPSVSCHCSQLMSLLSSHVSFSGLNQGKLARLSTPVVLPTLLLYFRFPLFF